MDWWESDESGGPKPTLDPTKFHGEFLIFQKGTMVDSVSPNGVSSLIKPPGSSPTPIFR